MQTERSPSDTRLNKNMIELFTLKNTLGDLNLESKIQTAAARPPLRRDRSFGGTVEDLGIFSVPAQEPRPSKSSRQNQSQAKTEKRQLTQPSAPSIDDQVLERIRATVQAFLCQRPSIHEYTIPRLFIVLPDEPTDQNPGSSSGRRDSVKSSFSTTSTQYRLYFLCECSSSFTLPLGSGLNHLHIAKHAGYGVDPGRQEEFFNRYARMILTLLIFLKHGHHPSEASTPHGEEAPDMVLKRVDKLSSLKKIDLPDSIVYHLDQRVNRMIQFLEWFLEKRDRGPHSSDPEKDGGVMSGTEQSPAHQRLRLTGLSSLTDLHHLYSFLGIANTSIRYQSGQLGNLYRVGNIRGQASWVCVYHYRWTFLEKNIDDFERWIVTRGGVFDKQTGSVSITLVSRQHTKTFCSWVTNKIAPSLVEVHLKLGWNFGKKDLARLAKALTESTATVLTLDGCSTVDDSTYKIFHKKYDPMFHLLTQGQIHFLRLLHLPSFFSRLSPRLIKIPSLRRLELGQGMTFDRTDQTSFTTFLTSCSSLQELSLPGLSISDLQMTAVLTGVKNNENMTTLDLSSSCLDDGAAIILAQGLFTTSVRHLDLSRNERLSDTGAARVIRAIGPRLTSLKMAQTGFGDLAAAALAKSMDGISIRHTLRDQLQLQHRLDIAALTAGHRPGLRVRVGDMPLTVPESTDAREQTHTVSHLVYLDIEDNRCTSEGFRSLAGIKSRLYLLYLNLAGSRDLEDEDCALIMGKVASSALVTIRMACTGFGNASAVALANSLKIHPPGNKHSDTTNRKPSGPCQLEELDLHGCPIGSEGFVALQEAFSEIQACSSLKIVDLGLCGSLQDDISVQLLKTLLIPNGVERLPEIPLMNQSRRSSALLRSVSAVAMAKKRGFVDTNSSSRSMLQRSDSTPALPTHREDEETLPTTIESQIEFPPLTVLPIQDGFFTNIRQLDLKSTRIGDNSAWLLSQALIQPWIMIESLTVLEPMNMSAQGIVWIIDALCENTTVTELGIGKSDLGVQQSLDLEFVGSELVNLMEGNKRIKTLTTLGAPLGAIAKGLLLNHSLHSVYLIRSRGQLEDLQLMGQALGFNRALLVLWMGGSDESLFSSPRTEVVHVHQHQSLTNTNTLLNQQQQPQEYQQPQLSAAEENNYRNFHLQLQEQLQDSEKQDRSLYKRMMGTSLMARLGSLSYTGDPSVRLLRQRSITSRRHSKTFMSRVAPTKPGQVNGSRSKTGSTTAAGGALGSPTWTKNPLIDGIRRNHSLIKVTLDSSPSLTASASVQAMAPMSTTSTWSTNTNATSKIQDPGQGYGQQHHQIQLFQHHMMQKKILANRKLMRERGRVGVDELRLLGIDDDIIREICP
ncbi:hypothetical protein BGZ83_004276 [Gryganskiella cystojenkinii]|nr:hypothetical protein BGZ83_004276 [Gryganskiella cystojenkinii]